MKAVAVGARSMTSVQFHRDNHFVPCVYLKGWAGPDGKIATYRVLVPHEKFPTWRRYSPSALAYHSHLYTQTTSGVEKDDIETWLDQDFERAVVPLWSFDDAESAFVGVERDTSIDIDFFSPYTHC
jgi:Protein of unknown function (DUF4238)